MRPGYDVSIARKFGRLLASLAGERFLEQLQISPLDLFEAV